MIGLPDLNAYLLISVIDNNQIMDVPKYVMKIR